MERKGREGKGGEGSEAERWGGMVGETDGGWRIDR